MFHVAQYITCRLLLVSLDIFSIIVSTRSDKKYTLVNDRIQILGDFEETNSKTDHKQTREEKNNQHIPSEPLYCSYSSLNSSSSSNVQAAALWLADL